MIAQILIVNTAFYTYSNIRLKEIGILNWFEQIKENIIAGSARQLGHGFHTWPLSTSLWKMFFAWHFILNEIFSMVILSLPLIQEGQLSVSGKRMCTTLVNRLED